MKIGNETPTEPGTYAAQVYYGWKLLEWKHDCWMLEGGTATWAAGDPIQWVGPLPVLIRKDTKPAAPSMEFDL